MGIRSKNNEVGKRSGREFLPGVFVAGILILAATAAFLSQYQSFKERATVDGPNLLSGSEFLHQVYQLNMVLYKQIQETATGEGISYQDIYLDGEESVARAEEVAKYYDFGKDTPLSYAGQYLDELLETWNTELLSGLAGQMDYQITDNESGVNLANTRRDLKQLGTENADEELTAYYSYYIKLRFGESGFLERVWVRGEDADALLQSVQRVMKSRYLERCLYENLSYSPYGGVNWEDDIYYGSEGNLRKMRLSVANLPKGCTICYALTEEQLETVKASSQVFLSMRSADNYYDIGIQNFFRTLLAVLAVLAVLLPLWKGYRLHEPAFLSLHVESVVILLPCYFFILGEMTACMVQYAMSEGPDHSLAYMLQSDLPWISAGEADGIVLVVNLLFLVAVFTLWFLLVTSLCQVYVHGVRKYFRKRCFCYRAFRSARIYVRRKKTSLKRELLHVDLEQKTEPGVGGLLFKLGAGNYLVLALIGLVWALGAFLFAVYSASGVSWFVKTVVYGAFLLVVYSAGLYMLFKRYLDVIREKYGCMLEAARSLAAGNLQTSFEGDWGMFELVKGQLQEIRTGFSKAVEEEVKSQRMRTDLITNVSHDLKTPLTAIITYIDLLKEEGVTEKQRREYLGVLERKSLRLKALIEDLFEVSKASSGNVTFHMDKVDICHLVRQVYLEYEDKAGKADLAFRFHFPEEKVFLTLDGEKTCRVFDNLYINIIKYAMPHTRVYVSVEKREDEVQIELKNISSSELNVLPETLTERFVRGDSSRSSEGSGLGLAIARSFVELQGGRMQIEIDGDLFKVALAWKAPA